MRKRVDGFITKALHKERKRFAGLLKELDNLGSDPTGRAPPAKRSYKKRRKKVAAKYRGPKGELWSGRGMMPLWMRPLLKGGKKKEHFAIKPKK